MRPRFQADENFNAKIIGGVLRREPSLQFQTAKAGNLLGLGDPEVLAIAAQNGRILVSHDRQTMPTHFSRFITGTTSAGLVIVAQGLDIRVAIEQILLIWAASEASEWVNRIWFIPF